MSEPAGVKYCPASGAARTCIDLARGIGVFDRDDGVGTPGQRSPRRNPDRFAFADGARGRQAHANLADDPPRLRAVGRANRETVHGGAGLRRELFVRDRVGGQDAAESGGERDAFDTHGSEPDGGLIGAQGLERRRQLRGLECRSR